MTGIGDVGLALLLATGLTGWTTGAILPFPLVCGWC